MLKNIIKDKTLIFLIVISFINVIAYAIGGIFISIKYFTLCLNFIVLFFCKPEKSLPIVFYFHCNSALYDDIGFPYIFNFSIMIVLFKEILLYHSQLKKSTTILFIVLFIYNLCLIILNNIYSFNILLSMISWAASYLILIMYSSSKKTDFEIIYRYFFIGFVMSCLYAILIPLKIWGCNIPTAYRFIGLLRDPNYYSFNSLFLIFSAKTYAKSINKKPIFYIIISGGLGILSVSKMFILLVIVGIFLYFIFNIKKFKFKPYQILLTSILIFIIFLIAYNSNFMDILISKYTYRTDTTSLFTGRDKIQPYYINDLCNNPLKLLFGQSTSYSLLSNIGDSLGDFFSNMVAHNTYLDIILSWGLLFTFVYIVFIYKIIKNSYYVGINRITNNCKVIIMIFLFGLFSLSYLQADIFALLILFIILLNKKENEVQ